MPNLAFSNPTPKVGLDGLYMIMFLNQSAVMQVLHKDEIPYLMHSSINNEWRA
jgi:hypothetical protein